MARGGSLRLIPPLGEGGNQERSADARRTLERLYGVTAVIATAVGAISGLTAVA